MIAETVEINLPTGGHQIQVIETVRLKDAGPIVIIDKIHRAIGMIETIPPTRKTQL